MKKLMPALLCMALAACSAKPGLGELMNEAGQLSASQCCILAESLDEGSMPRTFENGKPVLSGMKWWCSGFFPGSCWYSYLLSGDGSVLEAARAQTEKMLDVDSYFTHHDIGFQIMCSAGLAFRHTGDARYLPSIERAAELLAGRFSPVTGTIKSWDAPDYSHPVIIDNMMNLELLTFAASMFGREDWKAIAVSHADKTLENHFRPDGSSFHLVDYDPESGAVLRKMTVQGWSDDSAWSRGQSWGLYGYTMMYRETGLERYLHHAEKIAAFLLPLLEKDPVPAWDFCAPADMAGQKDASAGAVMASAFIELSHLTKDAGLAARCLSQAEKTLSALCSPDYLAAPGELGGFLLKHSTGFYLKGSEVDVPLTYADYYFLEAIYRYKTLESEARVSPSHPRIFARADGFDNLRRRLDSGDSAPLLRMHQIEMAAADSLVRDTSAVGLRFDAPGKRLLSTSAALDRAVPCIYAYKTTGRKEHLDRALALVKEVCSFPDWNPSHFLDAANAGYMCALAYDWLYDELDAATKEMILTSLRDKLIFPSMDGKYEYLLRKFNNWNQVCNGGLILSAIALADRDPLLAARVIDQSVERNRTAFRTMVAPDGVYPEGPLYMAFGMGWQLMILSALESACGTDFGLGDVPGLDEAGYYRLFSYGPGNRLFNFSDNSEDGSIFAGGLSFPLMWYFAGRTGDSSLLSKEVELLGNYKPGQLPSNLYPLFILQAASFKCGEIKAPERKLFAGRGAQPLVIARTGWGDDDLYLGVKGGNPALEHAHMDAGSFVFDAWGYRWASDMGRRDYAYYEKRLPGGHDLWRKDEASPRWKLCAYSNRFHNTLTVNGEDHAVTGYVPLVEVYEDENCMGGCFDMNNAFKCNTLRAMRTAVIRNGAWLEITDDVQATEDGGCNLRWNLLTRADVSVTEDGLLLSQGDVCAVLGAEGADVSWYAAPVNPSEDGYASWDWAPQGLTLCGWTCNLAANERIVVRTSLKKCGQ